MPNCKLITNEKPHYNFLDLQNFAHYFHFVAHSVVQSFFYFIILFSIILSSILYTILFHTFNYHTFIYHFHSTLLSSFYINYFARCSMAIQRTHGWLLSLLSLSLSPLPLLLDEQNYFLFEFLSIYYGDSVRSMA